MPVRLDQLIGWIHKSFHRHRYPRLAMVTIGGFIGGILAATSLFFAVPIGLSASVGLGVALTWLGVVLGTISAAVAAIGTIVSLLLWLYHRVLKTDS